MVRLKRAEAELATANEQLKKEVAERKRAEQALLESERESRLIVDSIPGLVATLTPAGEVEAVNKIGRASCRKRMEELKEWTTKDTDNPEDLPRITQLFTQMITLGEP